MTIDEAIRHCEEVAEKNECKMTSDDGYTDVSMKQCAADHRQLAEWLTELKEAKRLLKLAVEDFKRYNCHTAICDTCKHNDNCDCDDNFIWRYKDEVFKIIDKE